MKRTFIKISAFATIGLVLASCNNEEANKKAQEADDLAVQALVETKNLELDSAVWAECDAKVLVAAQEAVAAAKKSVKPATKPKPKPAPAPVAKAEPTKPAPDALGSGKVGVQNTAPKQLGEGKQGTQKTPEESKLGSGKQGVKKP